MAAGEGGPVASTEALAEAVRARVDDKAARGQLAGVPGPGWPVVSVDGGLASRQLEALVESEDAAGLRRFTGAVSLRGIDEVWVVGDCYVRNRPRPVVRTFASGRAPERHSVGGVEASGAGHRPMELTEVCLARGRFGGGVSWRPHMQTRPTGSPPGQTRDGGSRQATPTGDPPAGAGWHRLTLHDSSSYLASCMSLSASDRYLRYSATSPVGSGERRNSSRRRPVST